MLFNFSNCVNLRGALEWMLGEGRMKEIKGSPWFPREKKKFEEKEDNFRTEVFGDETSVKTLKIGSHGLKRAECQLLGKSKSARAIFGSVQADGSSMQS